jgi:GNAT superfamily N-acetyltransferase
MKVLPLVIRGNTFEVVDGLKVAAYGEIYNYTGCWTLVSGFVRKEYRGQGLHKRLIRARVKEVFKRGGKQVRAWVHPRNAYSLNNLVDEGFRFIKTKKKKSDDHICLVLDKS